MSDKLFFEINFNQENKKNKINKIKNEKSKKYAKSSERLNLS